MFWFRSLELFWAQRSARHFWDKEGRGNSEGDEKQIL